MWRARSTVDYFSTAEFSLHPGSCCWKLSVEALDCQRLVFEALSGWQGRGRDGHLFRQSLKSFHCPRLLMNDCFLCGVGSGPVFVFSRGRLRATWDVLWRFNSFSYVVDGVLLVLVLKNSRLLKWCRLSYLDHISWSYFSRFFYKGKKDWAREES